MTRLAIIDRADMNAEQARVYDAAKQAGGPVGGPYYAYIRLPKLFEASQNLRGCLASGPLSKREQQVVNLVVARHWGARYPWFAQVRASLAAGIPQSVIDRSHGRRERRRMVGRRGRCATTTRGRGRRAVDAADASPSRGPAGAAASGCGFRLRLRRPAARASSRAVTSRGGS